MTDICQGCQHSHEPSGKKTTVGGQMEIVLPLLGTLTILGWYGISTVLSDWGKWWWAIVLVIGLVILIGVMLLRRMTEPRFHRFHPRLN